MKFFKNAFKNAVVLLLILSYISCDSLDPSNSDQRVTLEDALQENYTFTTPVYNIRVAIDMSVNLTVNEVLTKIDQEAMDFLDCQFFEGSDIGFNEFTLSNQEVVPPLSQLRILVVPNNFECDAVDKNVCAGIQFGGSNDLIIVAREGFGRCGDIPLLKHELAHRYGLLGDHSNQDEFSGCSDPENCGIVDFLDTFNIFG